MTRLSVQIAELLNNLIPPFAIHRDLNDDKQSTELYQEREYREAQKVCQEFGSLWNVQGHRILDVGSGLGGKPQYYADLGAHQVVTIDLRFGSVQATQSLARQHHSTAIVQPTMGDAAHLPFPADYFDMIISINVFEHVADLYKTLEECKRVLRPGGAMFLHFPPFYSPWGAHLEGWVDFPWPHLLFSDKTLLEVAQRVDARRENNLHYIAPAKVDWSSFERLPDLNRVTVSQFLAMVRILDFTILKVQLLPFGRHYFAPGGLLARGFLALLKALCTFPMLREVLTTKMVFVLAKQ